MRKLITLPLLFLILIVRSQTKEPIVRVRQINDTCWQRDYYNEKGPLIRSEQFATRSGKVLHGVKRLYNENGLLDSTATYRKGKREGEAYKLSSDSLKYLMKYFYSDDSLISMTDLTISKKDSADHADEKESEYPGGPAQWLRYLNKNAKFPDRAIKLKAHGRVTVIFNIGKDGSVESAGIAKSVEYSLDDEAIRLIENSGRWSPAKKAGKPLKSYKIQPIDFNIE